MRLIYKNWLYLYTFTYNNLQMKLKQFHSNSTYNNKIISNKFNKTCEQSI